MIRQIFEDLFKKASKEEMIGRGIEKLQYAGMRNETYDLDTTITVRVRAQIVVNEYEDTLRDRMSDAKAYRINFLDRRGMEAEIAHQLVKAVSKEVGEDMSENQSIGSATSVGFFNEIKNRAMEAIKLY